MSFEVITNPAFTPRTGFTNAQFKKLDELYCRGVAGKVLYDRAVECDFDEGIASYTYYERPNSPPLFQFLIRRVGPHSMMYELYEQGKGRVAKSSVFDRVYADLKERFEALV